MFGTCELSCATSAVSVEPFGRVGTAMLMTSSVRATVKTPSLNCTSRCTLRPLPLDVAVSGFPIIAMHHPPVRVLGAFRPSTQLRYPPGTIADRHLDARIPQLPAPLKGSLGRGLGDDLVVGTETPPQRCLNRPERLHIVIHGDDCGCLLYT